MEKSNTALRQEIMLLRSFVIGLAGKDPEGKYKASFVKKMFRALQEKPRFVFKTKADFLKHIS